MTDRVFTDRDGVRWSVEETGQVIETETKRPGSTQYTPTAPYYPVTFTNAATAERRDGLLRLRLSDASSKHLQTALDRAEKEPDRS